MINAAHVHHNVLVHAHNFRFAVDGDDLLPVATLKNSLLYGLMKKWNSYSTLVYNTTKIQIGIDWETCLTKYWHIWSESPATTFLDFGVETADVNNSTENKLSPT